MKLAKKEGHAPHYLSMTATPIPRTLALTIYGDLDLSIIDEMPAGRKKVITEIVSPAKREKAYEAVHRELALGRQAYVICPRIDEPDPDKEQAVIAKSVLAEAKRLAKDVFPKYRIGVMHSKMTKQKKEDIMQEFKDHELDILVSTSVIEVGVNVPNATSIIIEGTERFGLAQLHQLRGRVIRSNHQSYCYLFADAKTDKTMDRLKALTKASNGFELAELDLSLRGAGLLGGEKQWGITDLGMEAIKNIKMVEAARTEAINLIKKEPQLSSLPRLAKMLSEKNLNLHFE
jgi:ATP-dependent DNA helicase RecG